MPEGTKVDNMYKDIRHSNPNIPVGEAVAIAQKKTGQALATGKPPKHNANLRRKALAKAFGKE